MNDRPQDAMNPSSYIVIAYRWGWTNYSHYFVYAGPDREKALAMARAEQADRGGKYGCAVLEFSAGGDAYILLGHFPSAHDEKEPCNNRRLDELQALGLLLEEWQRGGVLLPDPDKEGLLKVTEVEPVPAWLEGELRRREALNAQVSKIYADAGLPVEAAILPPEHAVPPLAAAAMRQAAEGALQAFNDALDLEQRLDGEAYHTAMVCAAEFIARRMSPIMPPWLQHELGAPRVEAAARAGSDD